ncbi:MAG TPA: PAS domain S-box protein [Syntrophobacter fumaroxidans]|nr:PAS domain S-box protein [Syntrophobacter fumaroxidans]
MSDRDTSEDLLRQEIARLRERIRQLERAESSARHMEKFLRESRQRFKQIFSASPICIELYDENGILVNANRACLEMFGVSGFSTVKHFDLFKDPNLPEDVIRCLREGMTVRLEVPFDFNRVRELNLYPTSKEGLVYLDVLIAPLISEEGGKPSGYLAQVQDITEKLGMIRELQDNEARFRGIIEDQTELIIRFHPDGRLTFVNDAYCRYFERSKEFFLGRNYLGSVHSKDRPRLKKVLTSLTRSHPVEMVEQRSLRCNEKLCWQQWSYRAIFDGSGELTEYQAVGRDTTDRKMLEEIWKKYEFIVNTSGDIMVLIAPGYTYEAVNTALCKAVGAGREEIVGRGLSEVWGEEYFNENRGCLDRCFKGEVVHYELWTPHKEEGPRFYGVSCYPYYGRRDRVTHVVSVCRDMTDARLAKEALQRSEEKYRSIFEHGVIGIFQATLQGKHLSLNPAFARMLGYESPEEVMRLVSNIAEQVYADPRQRTELLKRLAEGGELVKVESDLLRKNGKSITVNQNIRLVRDEKGNPLYLEGFIEDITERKKLEMAIKDSERQLKYLSSRLLTAQEEERKRVAAELHDSIGQSLAAIKYGVENAVRYGASAGEETAFHSLGLLIPIIQGAIEEARRLYMGLRPSMLDDLGVIVTIDWLCKEFRRNYPEMRISERIELEEDSIPESLKIVIFRVVEEALNNISRHSRAQGVEVALSISGGAIRLDVADDGVGFDQDSLHHAVESEKGFGLAGMRERVALSGGSLSVSSIRGKGTTVSVSWPVPASPGTAKSPRRR